eukprot:COSAG02_NODE_2202_length_9534_cov_20.277160_1_plen_54_part_10
MFDALREDRVFCVFVPRGQWLSTGCGQHTVGGEDGAEATVCIEVVRAGEGVEAV